MPGARVPTRFSSPAAWAAPEVWAAIASHAGILRSGWNTVVGSPSMCARVIAA